MGEQTAKAPGLNRAKTYQLVLFPLNNVATNVYYVLVLSYIATFGSKVLALSMLFASVMVTGMRLFDAITDPIIGALMLEFIVDRLPQTGDGRNSRSGQGLRFLPLTREKQRNDLFRDRLFILNPRLQVTP